MQCTQCFCPTCGKTQNLGIKSELVSNRLLALLTQGQCSGTLVRLPEVSTGANMTDRQLQHYKWMRKYCLMTHWEALERIYGHSRPGRRVSS